VIAIPRVLARQFRAVLRRCLTEPGSRPSLPAILARCDGQTLTLQACGPLVGVRHESPSQGPAAVLAFRAQALAQFEGRSDEIAVLDEVAAGQGRASWSEGNLPRAVEVDTLDPKDLPTPPAVPPQLELMPEELLIALGEAARTTARESTRFAVSQVQLRGKTGQVAATDARQMLLQSGFSFPWADNVLVPRLPLLDIPGTAFSAPVAVARLDCTVILRAAEWTFWLRIEENGRFPVVEDAIPRITRPSRLHLHPEDAQFLMATLPKLPGRDDDYSPVTLDLTTPPAVRARSAKGNLATEVVLARSTSAGPAVRVVTDRRYLHRAAQMAFEDIIVVRPDVPLLCRDERRVYVWMPLEANSAIGPAPNMPRFVSAEVPPVAVDQPSPQSKRINIMPAPGRNGHDPDDRAPPSSVPDRSFGGGISELYAEAEALRNLLADASARAAHLVAALKQHKRTAKAVEAAVSSLRDIKLGF
jgi:hypothetical protein